MIPAQVVSMLARRSNQHVLCTSTSNSITPTAAKANTASWMGLKVYLHGCDLDLDLVMPLCVLGSLDKKGPEGDGYKRHSKLIAHLACEDCNKQHQVNGSCTCRALKLAL